MYKSVQLFIALVVAAVLMQRIRGRSSAPDLAPVWPQWDEHTPEDAWVEPSADTAALVTHPVKVKLSSGIFHLPGTRNYERTNADRWYVSAEAAAADGFRASKT
jgi:hypothetical protein